MATDMTGRIRLTARERARAEIAGEIKVEARRQLATTGAQLSLRAVARELGMVSSALYRYFPSRDDLLTALIIDAYDAMGEVAETAIAAGARPRVRWLAACHAIRGWALAHPHEYSLIYGSPVPGYRAPQATVGPASRGAVGGRGPRRDRLDAAVRDDQLRAVRPVRGVVRARGRPVRLRGRAAGRVRGPGVSQRLPPRADTLTRVKVLVTGGAGYIGSVVTHDLADAGHEVVVLDDLSAGFAFTIPAGVEFHQLSVHEIGRVLTPGAGFDAVLHFAGRIEVAESVARPDLYWNINVAGSMAVLDAIRAAGTPRMIFSSTGSMYDAADTGKLTEDAPGGPRTPYAATKLGVDLMLAGAAGAFGLGAASLRYFNAAGAVGPLGERHNPESHLIPIVLQVAGGQREELMLYGDDYPTPDGSCVRDYIHVADLASAHLLALGAIEPSRHEIYNLGNGDGYSNRQVIEAVREVPGRPVPVKPPPRRPGDAAATVAASDKARRDLGWRPARPDLREIIADAWAFHQASW